MANLLHGVGDLVVRTTQLTDQRLIPLYPFAFNLSVDSTELQAQGQVAGVLKTLAAAVGETSYSLTLSSQYIDWATFGLLSNQRPSTDASVNINVTKTAVIPAAADYEVVDADIVPGVVDQVLAAVSSTALGIEPRTMVAAAPSAGEIQVDGAATKLIFDASDAGKTVTYSVPVTKTSLEYYGGDNSNKYGTLEFWGKLYGTGWHIYFPSVDFSGEPSLDLSGDVATMEISMTANVAISEGFAFPYKIWND